MRAHSLLAGMPLPESARQTRIALNEAIDQVAAQLGNTRAVCRRCYIHPGVIDSWERGVLDEETKAARRSIRNPRAGLDAEEALVLKWLKSKA